MKGNHMTQAISANETALQEKQTRARYILALGHMCTDINQGTLAAILPFLVAAYHYDYTTAALLVMASNLAGSIIQPIFGHMADKKNRPYCMLLGVCLAGGGMALTGFLSNFYALCVAVMISGIGIALFHPQAAKLVNATSGAKKKGTSMGVFSFGGNLGFTLGPILATLGITLFGLKGTIIFLIPMGMGIGLCYSPMVISGQQYLPNHMGFASGVTLGLAVSIGGTVTPVLGHIADLKGLTGAFVLLGFLGAAIWITALFLKNLRTEPAAARAQTEK